ncbi:MAG TPA: STAS domain-containing protein [Acidimicrobiales bacterium]|nr:STAS domain-containing protein [Acidimicrobiales bacterium]
MGKPGDIPRAVFDVVVERRPDVLVVGLVGELDVACADTLSELVAAEFGQLDRDVVFNLGGLDFIDLTGAQLLAATAEVVARSGRRCTVTSASPLAALVIAFAGFAGLLPTLRSSAAPVPN